MMDDKARKLWFEKSFVSYKMRIITIVKSFSLERIIRKQFQAFERLLPFAYFNILLL